MDRRETFGTRIGFILVSAGCAIGIGNVWKFPYMAGQNGGAVFVLFYLVFLIIMGIPVMTMEFAVGRASRSSAIQSFKVLEKPGEKWHIFGKETCPIRRSGWLWLRTWHSCLLRERLTEWEKRA